MTILDLKSHYSHFLKGHEGKLHFAAHSHHFWPDVTRAAHLQYWDDCAMSSDQKWDKIFGEIIPKAQAHVAKILNLKTPDQIVFAPNTHELLSRILSLFLGQNSLSILTTSSEFHSFRRQIQRLSELPSVTVEEVSTESVLENKNLFLDQIIEGLKTKPNLLFLSQVFFDSGLTLNEQDIELILENKDPNTLFVLDGYHGFAALPFDLSRFEGKIFYLAGGYKYAQAGEGAAFLVVPKGNWRPSYTGWFAEFGELHKSKEAQVGYAKDGLAFIGATQDYSGLYRFNACWDLMSELSLDIKMIHQHVLTLQEQFLSQLPHTFKENFKLQGLFHSNLKHHGHFLTFRASSPEAALKLYNLLKSKDIITDCRGDRLRFGFGLYQNHKDVELLLKKLN